MTRAERLAEIIGRDWATEDLDRAFLLDLLREARTVLADWEREPWRSHYPERGALLNDLAPLEER